MAALVAQISASGINAFALQSFEQVIKRLTSTPLLLPHGSIFVAWPNPPEIFEKARRRVRRWNSPQLNVYSEHSWAKCRVARGPEHPGKRVPLGTRMSRAKE